MLISMKQGPPPFGATMLKKRFKFIVAVSSLDDTDAGQDRWQHDHFVVMRDISKKCNRSFAQTITLDRYLTINEAFYLMKNQVPFKQ